MSNPVRPARIPPRVLTHEHAARYCGHDSLEEFDRWARDAGLRTVPGRRGKFYDRRQIDDALDRMMGVTPAAGESLADAYFETLGQ